MFSISDLFAAGMGGFIGSALRLVLGTSIQRALPLTLMPYGTMTANIVGCFAMGVLAAMDENSGLFGSQMKMFVFVGVLGGFTTFSSFGYETLVLFRGDEPIRALINVVVTVVCCLAAVSAGYALFKK